MVRVFPASQHPLIRAVLNRLIPAGGGFPGAGELDLLDHLDRAACSSAETRRMFVDGMRQIGVESGQRHGRAFEELAPAEQDAVLRHVESDRRAFFEALVSQVYQGYYSHPAVVRLLGLEARPPQPLGHALAPFDVTLVRSMSARAPLYRQP
jgi:hypothetical protein